MYSNAWLRNLNSIGECDRSRKYKRKGRLKDNSFLRRTHNCPNERDVFGGLESDSTARIPKAT